MPFIRGRYHINPIMGEALEAAREAEAALLALEQRAQNDRQQADQDADDASDDSSDSGDLPSGSRPIHRVEIEAAELVPSHSGRAARGFVARIHRQALPSSDSANPDSDGGFPLRPSTDAPASCDTHVFASHNDLIDFLRNQLAHDSNRRSSRS